MVAKYKVYIPRASSGSDTFPHPILGKAFVGEPNTVCTETYMFIGAFKDYEECENVISYINTRFLRFLVMLKKLRKIQLSRSTSSFPSKTSPNHGQMKNSTKNTTCRRKKSPLSSQ